MWQQSCDLTACLQREQHFGYYAFSGGWYSTECEIRCSRVACLAAIVRNFGVQWIC